MSAGESDARGSRSFWFQKRGTQDWLELLTIPDDRLEAWSSLEAISTNDMMSQVMSWILGVQGILSTSSTSARHEAPANLHDTSDKDLYFHTNPADAFSLVDLHACADLTSSTSSVSEERHSHFREAVKRRDHKKCVVTEHDLLYPEAVHIVPHNKGSPFLALLSNKRSDAGNELVDIDDPRNGITLSGTLHKHFARNVVAILPLKPATKGAVYLHLKYLPPDALTPQERQRTIWILEGRPNEQLPPHWLLGLACGLAFMKRFGTTQGHEHLTRSFSQDPSTRRYEDSIESKDALRPRKRDATKSTLPESDMISTPGTRNSKSRRVDAGIIGDSDLLDKILILTDVMRQGAYDQLSVAQKEEIASKQKEQQDRLQEDKVAEQNKSRSMVERWLSGASKGEEP